MAVTILCCIVLWKRQCLRWDCRLLLFQYYWVMGLGLLVSFPLNLYFSIDIVLTSAHSGGYVIIGVCPFVHAPACLLINSVTEKTYQWIFFKFTPIVHFRPNDRLFLIFLYCSTIYMPDTNISKRTCGFMFIIHSYLRPLQRLCNCCRLSICLLVNSVTQKF